MSHLRRETLVEFHWLHIGEASHQLAQAMVVQHGQRREHFEVFIHQQKCIKERRLMLKEQRRRKGVGIVVVGKIDVVEMNEGSGASLGSISKTIRFTSPAGASVWLESTKKKSPLFTQLAHSAPTSSTFFATSSILPAALSRLRNSVG